MHSTGSPNKKYVNLSDSVTLHAFVWNVKNDACSDYVWFSIDLDIFVLTLAFLAPLKLTNM